MTQFFIVIGAILSALAVGLGAFGAHGLSTILTANGRAGTFDTASQYHLTHAMALIFVGILIAQFPQQTQTLQLAGYAIIAGLVFFSGSLYILAIFNIPIMGAVAPIGGIAFIIGWLLIAWSGYQIT